MPEFIHVFLFTMMMKANYFSSCNSGINNKNIEVCHKKLCYAQ